MTPIQKIKVITILGTRPEIIRLSRTISWLDKFTNQKIIHTGQNSDYSLNEVFFSDLGVREPDYYLKVDTSSLGSILGNILISVEPILLEERPDAVLILGDTNSAIAAIMAKRLKIPIYHMEAGNRCFDLNVPEETNRVLVDHISDFNLVYTEHARRHLLMEGIHPRKIYLTGSPLREVLYEHKKKIEQSDVINRLGLTDKDYFLASLHRAESVDDKINLEELITCLEKVVSTFNMPVIVSTHPRTRLRLKQLLNRPICDQIQFHEPFGFFDYNKLQMQAYCVLSDSGSISEEAAILSFPAVTIRNSMERPEAIDAGSIILTGIDSDVVLMSIDLAVKSYGDCGYKHIPSNYEIDNTAERVVKLIVGTARLSNKWNNINPLSR